MKRLGAFLRSVIPADPTQLIFLSGVVLLFISPHLPWWPSRLIQSFGLSTGAGQAQQGLLELRLLLSVALYPMMFAGLAGYFFCFWTVRRVVHPILWMIFVPTMASFVLVLGKVFRLTRQPTSVFDSGSDLFAPVHWFQLSAWSRLPTGFYIGAGGLVLILVHTIIVSRGATPLPVSFSEQHESCACDLDFWARIRVLVFVVIGPYFLFLGLLALLVFELALIFSHTVSSGLLQTIGRLDSLVSTASLIGITLLVLGKFKERFRRIYLPLPSLLDLGIAFVLPMISSVAFPTAQYIMARVQWAAHEYGNFAPPRVSLFFNPENGWQPWLVLMLFAAFAEEAVFRGILLPNFCGMGFNVGFSLPGSSGLRSTSGLIVTRVCPQPARCST
jgi:membrane protease YdiL (CAAX protease family)